MYEVPLLVSNQIWLNNFLQMLIVLRSTLTASMTSNSKQKGLSSLLILYQARTLKGPFDCLLTSLSLMLILSQFRLVTYLHSSFKGCYSSGEVPTYSHITLDHVWASHIPLILNTFAKLYKFPIKPDCNVYCLCTKVCCNWRREIWIHCQCHEKFKITVVASNFNWISQHISSC